MNTTTPVLIDFYADWCEPCKQLSPLLEKIVSKEENQNKIILAKVNVDKVGEIAASFEIKTLPTVFTVHNGKLLDSLLGFTCIKKNLFAIG